jgi:enolase
VVGDDLFSTNLGKLQYGISYKSASGIIVKPSQVGTITDVIKVVKEAKENDVKTILSHRSGETDDAFISHLAVGLNCDYIKIGISGERVVKINEIIRIEEKL